MIYKIYNLFVFDPFKSPFHLLLVKTTPEPMSKDMMPFQVFWKNVDSLNPSLHTINNPENCIIGMISLVIVTPPQSVIMTFLEGIQTKETHFFSH